MVDCPIVTHMVMLLSSMWRVISWCRGRSEGEGMKFSLL